MTFPTFIRCCIHCEISHDLSSNQAQCLRSMLNSTHAKSSNEELLKGNIETISCSRSSRLRNWKLQLSLPSGWIYVSILFHCFKEWFEPRAFWKVDEKKKHEVPPKASAALATTAHHSKSRQLERLGPNENLFVQMKEFMFDCRQFYFAVYNSDMIQIWFNLSFSSHEAASNPFLLKRKADVSPHFLRGAKLPTTSGVSLGNMRAFLPVERVTTCHTLNPMSASLVKMPEIFWCIWDVFWSLDFWSHSDIWWLMFLDVNHLTHLIWSNPSQEIARKHCNHCLVLHNSCNS